MELLKVSALFALTAVLEIVGCYLPRMVLRQGRPVWLLRPAGAAVALAGMAIIALQPSAIDPMNR
jgi:small multidrug resistance family-3 protein